MEQVSTVGELAEEKLPPRLLFVESETAAMRSTLEVSGIVQRYH
jgi:hypothetical protein